jgi:hypothetical protein
MNNRFMNARDGKGPVLLMAALEGDGGQLDFPESVVLKHAETLLHIIEAPWAIPLGDRQRAASHLSKLTLCSAGVCKLVMGRARRYAQTMREYDASPWRPNAIQVLAKGPCCCELRDFLMELIESFPGMADGDLHAALASINLGFEHSKS